MPAASLDQSGCIIPLLSLPLSSQHPACGQSFSWALNGRRSKLLTEELVQSSINFEVYLVHELYKGVQIDAS